MICPNKICKAEIPEDSIYCDQCGTHLMFCIKCGAPSLGKFCPKDGGRLEYRQLEEESESLNPEKIDTPETPEIPKQSPVPPSPEPKIEEEPVPFGGTVVIPAPFAAPELTMDASDGTSLIINRNVLLGRAAGDFVPQLGHYSVISSRHAQITLENGVFSITDMNSTNKTYLNEEMLQPGKAYELKDNDIVTLANIQFMVHIK